MPEPGGGKGTAMKTPDPYAVPGIAQDATARKVSRVSRSLLRRHHPDTQTDPGTPEHQAAARALLQQARDAYAVLADPPAAQRA